MKMKNEIKAERDGTVAAIVVTAGDQVRHGEPLLEFES
jgi:biotin carboxyl carrier protein